MAKDFKASQVRTTQIIASGSTSGKPSLVILSASSPGVDFDGSGISSVPSAAGRDVFVFVSGTVGSFGTSTRGVTLFGGDIVISGTAYNSTGNAYGNVAGSNKQVQFNDVGNFGANSGLIYDKTPQALSVGTLYVTGTSLNVSGNTVLGDASGDTVTINGTTTFVGAGVTTTFAGDVAVNCGDLTSTATTFNLLNSTVTTLNVGGAATTVSIGNSGGTVTVPGNLTVNGTTTTINTTNLVVKDPIIYFGSSSAAGETTGGIALASGSNVANQAMVFGKVATNTWGVGRFDVQAGQATSMTTMEPIALRASKIELGNTNSYLTASSNNLIIQASDMHVSSSAEFIRDKALSFREGAFIQFTSDSSGQASITFGATPGNLSIGNASYPGPTGISQGIIHFDGVDLGSSFFFMSGSSESFSTTTFDFDVRKDNGPLRSRQTSDVNFFVTGSVGSKGTSTRGTALFGGDVVISGTLHGGSPLKVSGSMALSGSLRLQTQDSAPIVGTNESVLYVLDDTGTKKLYWKNSDGTQQQVGTGGSTSGTFNEVNSGGTISLVTTASVSVAGAKGFNYGVNQVGVDTFFFVSGSTSGRGNSSGDIAVFGGHTVFSGALFGGVNPDLGRTLLRQEASQIAFSREEGLTAGSVTGTDVFMFVSGAIESKNTSTRGATVFGGDAVISGNLHGGSRDLQITSNTIITGTLEVTGNVKLYSDVILGTAGGGGSQITRAGDTSKIGFSSDGTIQLDTSNAPGAGIVKFAKNATQYLIISQTNTAGNLASIAMLKAGNSEGIIGFTSLTGNDLSAAGTDTFFYVSGSAGSRGTSTRGTAVFGGDIVVSGNIRASEIELGSASAFVSSSNGSSLEIGAATQVLILSGGGATSLNPRNLPDVNFFVSGSVGAKDSTTLRGTADFGGDLMVSGQIFFGGDTTLPTSVSRMLNSGQIAYWQNWYPTNPVINLAAKFGAALSQFQVSTAQQNISGRLRIGNLSDTGTAYLHITRSLGAANTAPIKLQAGTLIAAPEEGAIEFNGTNFFVTSGSTRQAILTTLANNAAVTSSFHVSTGSNLSLIVPGTGTVGQIARSIILTSDRTPTPTTGSDVFVFVSGSTSSKGTSIRGTSVFGGDVVISGTLHGGVVTGSVTGMTIQASKVQVTSTTLSFGQSGGSDIGFFVSGSPGSRGVAFSGGTSLFGGDLYMSGSTYLGTVSEYMTLTQSLNSIQTFDMSSGSIFHSKALAGNVTANFTNVPTHEGRVVSANLIVSQSINAYIVSAIQVGGASQTLLWANGVTPTGNPGKHDVFGFSLIRSGSAWTVLGQMSTYG